MNGLMQCKSCGEYVSRSLVEDHVKEMHFWN
jgi:hypothetical protein